MESCTDLERHFERISPTHRKGSGTGAAFRTRVVEEPSAEETTEMLKGLRSRYEEHHKVKISDEAYGQPPSIGALRKRSLPADKAFDLV